MNKQFIEGSLCGKVLNLTNREIQSKITEELSHYIHQTGEAMPKSIWAVLGKLCMYTEHKN